MDKENVSLIYVQWNMYSNKKYSLVICEKWMGLEGIMLIEISQAGIDKYHMVSLACGI